MRAQVERSKSGARGRCAVCGGSNISIRQHPLVDLEHLVRSKAYLLPDSHQRASRAIKQELKSTRLTRYSFMLQGL